jgi:hypothetical protein
MWISLELEVWRLGVENCFIDNISESRYLQFQTPDF